METGSSEPPEVETETRPAIAKEGEAERETGASTGSGEAFGTETGAGLVLEKLRETEGEVGEVTRTREGTGVVTSRNPGPRDTEGEMEV